MKIVPLLLAVAFFPSVVNADPTPPKPATTNPVVYQLKYCVTKHNCSTVSEHPSSGTCEAAKKAYLKKHPTHSAGCNKRPY